MTDTAPGALTQTAPQCCPKARLNQLPDDELLAWQHKGCLPLVHAHRYSVGNWADPVGCRAGIKAAA